MIRYRRDTVAMPMGSVDRTILMSTMVLCLTLAVAAFAYIHQQQQNIQEVGERFDRLKNRVLGEVGLRMRLYEYGLQGTRGMMAAVGEDLSWSSFARYSASRDFESEFPGARGFGFIRKVTADDRAHFMRRAQDEMGPDFEVRQLQPHVGDSYIIQYIEPMERNLRVLGLDIASEPVRRATAVAAMRSGKTTLSAPVNLMQDTQAGSSGLLLVLPMYRYGMPTNTEAGRELALLGWVYAPLQMDEVLRNLDAEEAFFSMSLRDRLASSDAWLYGGELAPVAGFPKQPLALLELFGREWEVNLQPTQEFVDSLHLQEPQRKATEAGLFALLASALVVSMVYLGQRNRVQRLEQARRAAIVEGSDDAIIVQTLQGVITDWNDGARRLFGYAAADVLGHTAQELLVPVHLKAEDESMLARVAQGEHVKAYETVRSHRDGSLVEVSISAGPIVDADGRVVGLAKTLRDVRESRAAARRVAELNATLEDQVRERTGDLETARHALQTVLDAMPSQIGYWGRDLRNQVANRAYGDWFHIDPATVRGMHLSELIGQDMFAISLAHAEAALSGEARSFEQTRPATATEPARHMLVHYLPDTQDGAVKGFYAFVHDVTELTESRMQLAAAQRDNVALLQTLNQHAIVSVADRTGRIIEVNDAFCHISGFHRQELLGQNHRIVNSGEHDRAFWVSMWRTISSGQSWREEVCNRAKDGTLYWVDSVVAPFMDAYGRVEKYVSIRTDITNRKRTELELQRTLALLRAVLEASTQVAIVATDPRGVVSLLNRGAELLLDTHADKVVGQTNALAFFEADVPAKDAQPMGDETDGAGEFGALRRVAQFHQATQDPQTQWFMRRADGVRVPVSLAVTRMQDANGQFTGYLGIASDIRLRLEQEQSLRVAMQQANAANEAKSRFLANMSHEIRTPMNAVLGLSYLLARTALDEEQQGMLRRVQVASKALLAVINDILDLSKIEAGEMALERVPVDVNQVVRDVAALIDMQAREKGVAFVVDVNEPVPQPLEGDSTRLQQILINLLSNAMKFTERGEVRLTVRHEALGSGTFRVQMSVSDTGIGIAEDACKRLFAPFVQADLSTTRRYGGTGLGLSIVKQLVEMMHGTVEVHSKVGQGSRFVVTLPMHRSMGLLLHREAAPSLPMGQGLPGVRLLVVDDNETNQEIAARILQAEGAEVGVAGHGQAALDLLLARPQGFDAVLMDVHMPVLNGLDATRQIRSTPSLAGLPVIGLTAGVSLSEQTEAIGAGMNAVVGKPFDPPVLVRTLWRCLPGLAQRAGVAADANPPASPQPVPPDWPTLPGVSAAQSHARLKGHAPLLWQLARRIVACVGGLPALSAAPTPQEIDALKLPLHDLKGMAGSVGAQALHALASQAEDAARQQQPEVLAKVLAQVQPALQGWEAALAQSQPEVAHAPARQSADTPALDPATLARIGPLRAALQHRDLAALDEWDALAPALAHVLGPERQAALQQHLDALAFDEALALLDSALPTEDLSAF
ncbi:multi-sensor hybrid histidine kinase [Acidovorax sp. 56]|uniref:PAS domain S-box protein n=1 Tax=Acidovorax sp. 56 TaxID=2035205 RepID=UPI000C16574B|nr:PAS domain S-box protein [Acidovorax sp. 56]PIF29126.1 multi-sensor hybrid histidine kinase [Acidovorax sp. 56]